MTLSINHNLMAATAARNLSSQYAALSVSTQRLSSGLRINSAADDAAGLAIRELMRADIAGINQGIRNANDAISMIQTADGALQVIDEKLIRMKELAEQAATGTYTSDQRIIIDSEYQAMASEITRIANATDFNGIYLLNGNLSSSTHSGSGLNAAGKLKVHFGSGNSSAEDYYYVQIGCCTASALGFHGSSSITKADYIANNNLVFSSNDVLAMCTAFNTSPASVQSQFDSSQYSDMYMDQSSSYVYIFATDNSGDTHVIKGYNSGTYGYVSDTNLNEGASSSISTQELAQKALDTVKTAIVSKDKIRANLGAMQNRLENTVANLQIQAENLQAAESQISDTDVATEMTSFVRNQILTQSAVAMLSQANSLPKMALQLIQG